jgi:2Fe-2S ferredoxin
MPKVTFIDHKGKSRTVEAPTGTTVMEAATKNAIPDIEADCGGACACATCHVFVEPEWFEKTGERGPMEESMLDFADEVKETSRLSCQIRLDESLDGLVVHTPETQY